MSDHRTDRRATEAGRSVRVITFRRTPQSRDDLRSVAFCLDITAPRLPSSHLSMESSRGHRLEDEPRFGANHGTVEKAGLPTRRVVDGAFGIRVMDPLGSRVKPGSAMDGLWADLGLALLVFGESRLLDPRTVRLGTVIASLSHCTEITWSLDRARSRSVFHVDSELLKARRARLNGHAGTDSPHQYRSRSKRR